MVNGKSIHMALAAQNPIPKNHVRYCHCPTYERTSLISIPKRRVGQLKGIYTIHMAAQNPIPKSHVRC